MKQKVSIDEFLIFDEQVCIDVVDCDLEGMSGAAVVFQNSHRLVEELLCPFPVPHHVESLQQHSIKLDCFRMKSTLILS